MPCAGIHGLQRMSTLLRAVQFVHVFQLPHAQHLVQLRQRGDGIAAREDERVDARGFERRLLLLGPAGEQHLAWRRPASGRRPSPRPARRRPCRRSRCTRRWRRWRRRPCRRRRSCGGARWRWPRCRRQPGNCASRSARVECTARSPSAGEEHLRPLAGPGEVRVGSVAQRLERLRQPARRERCDRGAALHDRIDRRIGLDLDAVVGEHAGTRRRRSARRGRGRCCRRAPRPRARSRPG